MAVDKLLYEIADVLETECLSDLHNLSRGDWSFALERISTSNHSVEEWNYALSYILGQTVALAEFHGISDIYALLNRR